jgi:streptogramin lyase
LDNPFGVIRGPDGAVWFCEYSGQRIRRIDTKGNVHTIAGNGQRGYTGDGGLAIHATFHLPHEIRFDTQGDLYVVDMNNHVVRCIDKETQIIRTVAGTGKPGYAGDGGPATQASLKQPHSIQFGPEGDLWICDIGNHVVRRVDQKTGVIRTVAGTGKPVATVPTPESMPIDGTPILGPRSMDFDHDGHLWLATREGNQLFELDFQLDRMFHRAGTGQKGYSGQSGPARQLTLNGPKGIALDREGNAWLVDSESSTIWRYHRKTKTLERMAGTGEKGDGPDGDPLGCKLARPHGIYCDADGSVLIGDSESHRIRVLRSKTVASRMELVVGDKARDDQRLYEPFGTGLDATGHLWIVEMGSGNRLLEFFEGKLVHRAGKGAMGKTPASTTDEAMQAGDGGPGLNAQFNGPHNLAVHADGSIYLADTWNGRIRRFDPKSGVVQSLAGYDVPLGQAKSRGPYCITLDAQSRWLYVADLQRILAIDLTQSDVAQRTRVVAGNGQKGIPTDGSSALESPLVDPRAVAPDGLGNVYILERGGNALRVVDAQGRIRTVVNKSGKKGNTGDGGPAIDATMNGPKHIAVDRQNRVLIADAENHVIRRYDPATGTLQRIAGTGEPGSGGLGGDPRMCPLSRPHGIMPVPGSDDLYITDSYNDRILRVTHP